MIKHYISLICLFVMILIVVGCIPKNDSVPNSTGSLEDHILKQESKNIVDRNLSYSEKKPVLADNLINELLYSQNQKSFDELCIYDYYSFVNVAYPKIFGNVNPSSSKYYTSLNIYNQQFPIEWIKPIDVDHVYIVYKLRKDTDILYVYIVFQKLEMEHSGVCYEYWGNYGEYYFVKDGLYSNMFLEARIGDSIKDYSLIYNSVLLNVSPPFFSNNMDVIKRFSVCMLVDGIIIIDIRNAINPEEFFVNDISFYPYGKTTDEFVEDEWVAYCSILEDGFYPELPDFS